MSPNTGFMSPQAHSPVCDPTSMEKVREAIKRLDEVEAAVLEEEATHMQEHPSFADPSELRLVAEELEILDAEMDPILTIVGAHSKREQEASAASEEIDRVANRHKVMHEGRALSFLFFCDRFLDFLIFFYGYVKLCVFQQVIEILTELGKLLTGFDETINE